MTETEIDYAKLGAAVYNAPHEEVDAEIAGWPEHVRSRIPDRRQADAATRTELVRKHRPAAEASLVAQQERAAKEARHAAAAEAQRILNLKRDAEAANFARWQREGLAANGKPTRGYTLLHPELADEFAAGVIQGWQTRQVAPMQQPASLGIGIGGNKSAPVRHGEPVPGDKLPKMLYPAPAKLL